MSGQTRAPDPSHLQRPTPGGKVRLQKILAGAGVASRRTAEQWIARGRVTVDGVVVTQLGTQVDPAAQRIEVDGRAIRAEAFHYVLLHKPWGVVSTMDDPEGRPTVAQYVRHVPVRVVPVGRLDYATTGVLLLTNDGMLARALLHPSRKMDKVYEVELAGVKPDLDLRRLSDSILIDGRPTQPATLRVLARAPGTARVRLILREGRNRQVRRLAEHAGLTVRSLTRTTFAGLELRGLGPGQCRALSATEVAALKRRVQVTDGQSPRDRGCEEPEHAAEEDATRRHPGGDGSPRPAHRTVARRR